MKTPTLLSLFLLAFALLSLPAAAEDTDANPPPALKCESGLIAETYGNSPWLVYGCNDERSIVIVTAPENPGGPFYFKFSPQKDGYHLAGEGSGQKDIAAAAVKELKSLTKQDIMDLIEATKAQTQPKPQ